MTKIQLAEILSGMYNNAPLGEAVAHIHLFGIMYAHEIMKNNIKPIEIIKLAKMHQSYSTEVGKGMKLSKYVKVIE